MNKSQRTENKSENWVEAVSFLFLPKINVTLGTTVLSHIHVNQLFTIFMPARLAIHNLLEMVIKFNIRVVLQGPGDAQNRFCFCPCGGRNDRRVSGADVRAISHRFVSG